MRTPPSSRLAAPLALALLAAVPAALAEEAAPTPYETLDARVQKAFADGDAEAALTLALQLNEMVEQQHAWALLQVARAHGLAGRVDEVFEWLERAHQAGLHNVYQIRQDQAFAALAEQDRFVQLCRRIWAKAYIWMLERPEREEFQKPDLVMAALALRPGETVADIGSGSGYFTLRVARAVGEGGRVLAIDASQEMLDHLATRLVREGLTNVTLSKVGRDDPELPTGEVDTVLMVDTLHYVADKPAYARKLVEGLAADGRVVVIDYTPKPFEERPWGPPPHQQLPREELDAVMASAGLQPAAVHDFLPEQYFVEYRRAAEPPRPATGGS